MKIAKFTDAATKNLVLDQTLTVGDMRDQALALRNIRSGDIVFATAPFTGFGTSPQGASIDIVDEVRMAVVDLAEGLNGRIADLDAETLIVYASRTTVEAALARLTVDRSGPFGALRRMPDVTMGIGIGSTVRVAEENAQRALVMGERYGEVHIGFPDGEVQLATQEATAASYRLRETRGPTLRVAERLGLGPLAFARLVRALGQVDDTSLTATDLARAYGIAPRSARRLMTSLQRAGIATRMGVQGGPGAGRPQTVYRIDVAKLVPADEPEA